VFRFVVVAAVLSLDSGSHKQREKLKQPLSYDVAVLDGIKSMILLSFLLSLFFWSYFLLLLRLVIIIIYCYYYYLLSTDYYYYYCNFYSGGERSRRSEKESANGQVQ